MLGLIIYRTSSLFCSPGPATRWKIRKNLKRTKPHNKSSKPINQYILVMVQGWIPARIGKCTKSEMCFPGTYEPGKSLFPKLV